MDPSPIGIGAQLTVWLGSQLLISAAYVVALWYAHRRLGLAGAGLAWFSAALVYGYVMYRYTCAQPLTCDVVGPGWAWHYFIRVAPVYALVGVVAFGAGGLVLLRRSAWVRTSPLRLRDLILASLTTVGSWYLATAGIAALRLPAY